MPAHSREYAGMQSVMESDYYFFFTVIDLMMTGSRGVLPFNGVAAIFMTTSMPSVTLPNMV